MHLNGTESYSGNRDNIGELPSLCLEWSPGPWEGRGPAHSKLSWWQARASFV